MSIASPHLAPTPVFPSMGLTEVPDVAQSAPSAGPYDWSDVWGADSFVFRPDATRDVSSAQFA